MKAFILVALNGKSERETLEQLKSHKEVKHGYILFGEWDIIVEVEVKDTDELGTFVMDHVRNNPNIKLTSSLIVAGI